MNHTAVFFTTSSHNLVLWTQWLTCSASSCCCCCCLCSLKSCCFCCSIMCICTLFSCSNAIICFIMAACCWLPTYPGGGPDPWLGPTPEATPPAGWGGGMAPGGRDIPTTPCSCEDRQEGSTWSDGLLSSKSIIYPYANLAFSKIFLFAFLSQRGLIQLLHLSVSITL